jgi:hypothetical protein
MEAGDLHLMGNDPESWTDLVNPHIRERRQADEILNGRILHRRWNAL